MSSKSLNKVGAKIKKIIIKKVEKNGGKGGIGGGGEGGEGGGI